MIILDVRLNITIELIMINLVPYISHTMWIIEWIPMSPKQALVIYLKSTPALRDIYYVSESKILGIPAGNVIIYV